MIDRQDWIDFEALKTYVLKCQDLETGGISDRPGNEVDVFHTFFGLTALSLMNYYSLEKIDKRNLKNFRLSHPKRFHPPSTYTDTTTRSVKSVISDMKSGVIS